MNRIDNVGLAAEHLVAATLTNGGWFATLMPSATFPDIDVMARKDGFKPISVQVKGTRIGRGAVLFGSSSTKLRCAADLYVFVKGAVPGFTHAGWQTYVMTAADFRTVVQTNAQFHYVRIQDAYNAAYLDAWEKVAAISTPIQEMGAG